MYDLPPDLPRLRTLETWLAVTLDRVRQRIAEEEQQQTEIDSRQPPPPAPDWLIERDLSGRPTVLHAGDCHMKGKRVKPASEDQARQALANLEACQHCRPDTTLGVLD
jgi:hypothetical protein